MQCLLACSWFENPLVFLLPEGLFATNLIWREMTLMEGFFGCEVLREAKYMTLHDLEKEKGRGI